jgi:hypothetical protein
MKHKVFFFQYVLTLLVGLISVKNSTNIIFNLVDDQSYYDLSSLVKGETNSIPHLIIQFQKEMNK